MPSITDTHPCQQRDFTPINYENTKKSPNCALTHLPSPLLTQIGEYLMSPADTKDFRRFSQTCKTVHKEMGYSIEGQSLLDKANIIETKQKKQALSDCKQALSAYYASLPLFELAAHCGPLNADELTDEIDPFLTQLASHRLHTQRLETTSTRTSLSDRASAAHASHVNKAGKLEREILGYLSQRIPESVLAPFPDLEPELWSSLCRPGTDIGFIIAAHDEMTRGIAQHI